MKRPYIWLAYMLVLALLTGSLSACFGSATTVGDTTAADTTAGSATDTASGDTTAEPDSDTLPGDTTDESETDTSPTDTTDESETGTTEAETPAETEPEESETEPEIITPWDGTDKSVLAYLDAGDGNGLQVNGTTVIPYTSETWNGTYTGTVADAEVTLSAWAAVNGAYGAFGYILNEAAPVYSPDNAVYDATLDADAADKGGAKGYRFTVTVDISALAEGTHTLAFVYKNESGKGVSFLTLTLFIFDDTPLNYGIGEPTQELYGTAGTGSFTSMWATPEVNQYSTAENIAKINAAYGGNTMRIWSHTDEICWPNLSNNVTLNQNAVDAVQGVIDDCLANGVTEIIYWSNIVNTHGETKAFYDAANNKWLNHFEAMNQGVTAGYVSIITLPDDDGSKTGMSYEKFLKLQYDYFYLVATTFEGITVIEIFNEMEMGYNLFQMYIAEKKMPDMKLVAQVCMDVCKQATDAIAAAGKSDQIRVMMPSLATVDGREDIQRFDTIEFLKAEYDYIMTRGTGDADDYFQIINMHPYVMLSSDTSTSNYLYEQNGSTLTLQTQEQIATRWRSYILTLREIFIANGDGDKPIFITEFGMADYGYRKNGWFSGNGLGSYLSNDAWSDYKRNTLARQTMVFQTIYDIITQEMPYIETVIFFRLGDFTPMDTTNAFVAYGESTYGVIDKDGNLKDFGKNLYSILNGGSADYAELEAVIKAMKES